MSRNNVFSLAKIYNNCRFYRNLPAVADAEALYSGQAGIRLLTLNVLHKLQQVLPGAGTFCFPRQLLQRLFMFLHRKLFQPVDGDTVTFRFLYSCFTIISALGSTGS